VLPQCLSFSSGASPCTIHYIQSQGAICCWIMCSIPGSTQTSVSTIMCKLRERKQPRNAARYPLLQGSCFWDKSRAPLPQLLTLRSQCHVFRETSKNKLSLHSSFSVHLHPNRAPTTLRNGIEITDFCSPAISCSSPLLGSCTCRQTLIDQGCAVCRTSPANTMASQEELADILHASSPLARLGLRQSRARIPARGMTLPASSEQMPLT